MSGLVNFPDALLLLRASQLGLSVAGVITAYILYNAVYALAAYPLGAVSDRVPRHLVFAAGLGFFAVGYLGLGLVRAPGWVFLLLPLYGFFAAATDGVGKAWVADLAPADRSPAPKASTRPQPAGRSSSPAPGPAWPGLEHHRNPAPAGLRDHHRRPRRGHGRRRRPMVETPTPPVKAHSAQ